MKQFLTFIALLLTTISFAQNGNNSNTYYFRGTLAVGKGNMTVADTSSYLEVGNGFDNKGLLPPRVSDTTALVRKEGLFAYTKDSRTLSFFDGTRWRQITDKRYVDSLVAASGGGGSTDTTSLSNRINLKQDKLTGNGFVRAVGGVVSYDPNTYLTAEVDGDPLNEIQSLGRAGNQITLTNGGSVIDSSKTYLAGRGISILGGYPNYTVSVDTTSIFSDKVNYYDSTTVFVTPSQLGNGNISIGTSGISTGSISFNLNQKTNASTTINTPGTNLGSSTSGTDRTITSSTGTSTTFSIADNDNSSTNEIQNLSISGNNLSISSGNTVALPIPNVDSIVYQTVYRTDTMRTNIYNAIDGARTVGSTSIFKNGNSYEREALTGDVTATRNSNTTTISNNAVTNEKAADMAASTIKGRASGAGTGDPQDLTAAQVRTILNVADGANNYVHPNSGITPGTYNRVTVNAQGHATTGTLEPYLSRNDSNTVFITPKQLTDSLNGRVGNYLQFSDTLTKIATKSDIVAASGGTIQSLSNTKSGNNVALAISGGGAGTNFSVADADSSNTNELQTVSRSGQTITLSNSGGSFVDSFSRYAAGTNVTISGSYPAYTINATQPSLTNYVQYSDTNTVISTKRNLIDTAASLRATINTKEDAFAKGSIVAGTNITTSGTLTNRLVGAGNVTINAVVPSLTGYVQYSDTLTRIATRSYVDTAKANIRAQKEDAFSKGSLIQGTNATLTGTLANRLVGAGNVTIDANLSSAVKYVDTLTTIATKKNLADTSAALRDLIGTKQNQLNGTGFVKASGTTISYDNSAYVPTNRTITINGNTQDLSANRTWTIPTIDTTSLSNRINTKQNYSDTLTYDATKTWVQAQGYLTTEVDGSVTNEIQTLGRSGSNITLSLGGGSVVDSSRTYSAGSNITITGTYPNYTVNAIQPSLTGYVQFSDTLTRIATRSYIDTAKVNIRNEKENTFLKGNVVAGTGVTLSGTTTGRLVGSDNITINATPTDLSGVVKYTDTLTRIATRSYVDTAKANIRSQIDTKENAFSKGNIIAGSNVIIDGTLTNRLVGSGNVTINAVALDTTSLSNRINQKIDTTQKAQPNGVATLGGDGKIPTSQLPDAILGAVIYQGTYSVVTNTPTLPTATGNKGKYYVVTDSGLYAPNSTVYRQGDWIISNGAVWQKVDNNNNVTSVNGQVGNVTILTNSDLALGTRTSTTMPITNSNGTGVTLPPATTTLAGLLTATDKTKLDGLSVPNNGTLNLSTSGIATGSATFTANQSTTSNFTVNVPGTNITSSLVGSAVTLTSSTGTGTSFNVGVLTETDPTVPSHVKAITTTNISNWNTAYSWGDHAGLYLRNGPNYVDANTSGLNWSGKNEGTTGFPEAYGSVLSFGSSGYLTQFNGQTGDNNVYFRNSGAHGWGTWQTMASKEWVNTVIHNPVTIGTANGLSLATQVLSLAAANTSTTGALTSTDWNTFNNKQTALSGTGVLSFAGTTPSYSAGTANQILRRNAANTAYEFFTPTWTSNTGTVTDFSAGTLSPLFTTSVATSTTTPTLSFALTNATANTWFGNAGASTAAPAYNALGALTRTNDANVTLTLGGTPTTALAKSVSMTLGWTGLLSVARGGTGAGTLTGVAIGNGTSAFTAVTGTANQLLRRNAANTAYEFFTPTYLTSYTETDPTAIKNQYTSAQTATGWINGLFRASQFIGDFSGFSINDGGGYWGFYSNSTFSATATSKMGGLVISDTYAPTEPTNGAYIKGAILNVNLAGTGTRMVTAASDGTLGVAALPTAYTGSTSITLSGTSFERAALTGDVTAAANSNATTIAANAVTYAKMQDIPTNSLIGRSAASTGDPSAITVGDGLLLSSGTLTANQLTITPSLDFPPLSGTGSTSYVDVSMTGALVGDVVTLGLPIDIGEALVDVKAYVIGSGTVRVRITAITNIIADYPPYPFTIKIIK